VALFLIVIIMGWCFLVYVKMSYMISEGMDLVGVGGVPDCSKFYSLSDYYYFSMRV
jgi:hypothetical protein